MSKTSHESCSEGKTDGDYTLIKFATLKPHWPTGAVSPEFVLPYYRYCDGSFPTMPMAVRPGAKSSELRMVAGVCQPGQGMPLHDHTGEELMFSAGGDWVIYFDLEETERVFLGPWDGILIEGGKPRGWRNVGTDVGCLLNISRVEDRMRVLPPPDLE